MKTLYMTILATAIASASAAPAFAADPATKGKAAESAPDNTGRNVRDRGATLTSGDQSESKADITTTQKIRQAVMADKSLSMTAHNVKIITVDGVVTLRGPVKTDAERTNIASKATELAGSGKVQNYLEVAGAK
jgi:hyperosmotically inducible periplasmic protein